MRISKDLARQIALKLTQKSRDKRDKLKAAWEEAVTISYIQQIPEKVIKLQSLYPEWFKISGNIILEGHGFSWTNVNATEHVIKGKSDNCFLKLDAKLAGQLKALQNAYQDAKQAETNLFEEIETAILGLGTSKKVADHFPDAAKYLPPDGARSMALIPDLSKLTNKIKNQ
jgi:hypothetical protein